jgi:hypothetical protein
MSGDENGTAVGNGGACPKCTWYHAPDAPCLKDDWLTHTPDDITAPYGPYTHGERHRNPYYKALREVWRYKDGQPVELMIANDADVTDIIHAFGPDPDLAELLTKIFRLHRKPGTNKLQEYTKMHEHIQAAEDAWAACRVVERLEGEK